MAKKRERISALRASPRVKARPETRGNNATHCKAAHVRLLDLERSARAPRRGQERSVHAASSFGGRPEYGTTVSTRVSVAGYFGGARVCDPQQRSLIKRHPPFTGRW